MLTERGGGVGGMGHFRVVFFPGAQLTTFQQVEPEQEGGEVEGVVV